MKLATPHRYNHKRIVHDRVVTLAALSLTITACLTFQNIGLSYRNSVLSISEQEKLFEVTIKGAMQHKVYAASPSAEVVKGPSEKQLILNYIVEKFGDRAPDAISIINLCENHSFDPRRVSGLNIQQSGRRSYDIGVMQINADENDTKEIEKLKEYTYNIDRGYAKYKAAGNKFTAWTCATVIGEKNYLGK